MECFLCYYFVAIRFVKDVYKSFDKKDSLLCPTCRATTPLVPCEKSIKELLKPNFELIGLLPKNEKEKENEPENESEEAKKHRLLKRKRKRDEANKSDPCANCVALLSESDTDNNGGRIGEVYCKECEAVLCMKCDTTIHTPALMRKHNRVNVAECTSLTKRYCPSHPDGILEFWCTKDLLSVCKQCLFGEHQGHNMKPIEEGWNEAKKEACVGLVVLKQVQEELTIQEEHHVSMDVTIKENKEMVKQQIHDTFKRLKEAADNRCKELLDEVDAKSEKQMKGRQERLHQIKEGLKLLKGLEEEMNDMIADKEEWLDRGGGTVFDDLKKQTEEVRATSEQAEVSEETFVLDNVLLEEHEQVLREFGALHCVVCTFYVYSLFFFFF